MSIPYTYRVKFIPTGEYYYGVRYSKTCDPSDLWMTYFTSCKKVHKLIEEFGKDSFTTEIRKIFETKEAAIAWEERVTRKVIYWNNYLNAGSIKAFNHSKSTNGGIIAVKRGIGIHAMTSDEKSIAGKKGGTSLGKRKKESGLTDNEKQGIIDGHKKISARRKNGKWTLNELEAIKSTQERRVLGEWTDKETAAYAKLNKRRKEGKWTDNETSGFAKVSKVRKSGKWVTNGISNRFMSPPTEPDGWQYGFTRKKKGA